MLRNPCGGCRPAIGYYGNASAVTRHLDGSHAGRPGQRSSNSAVLPVQGERDEQPGCTLVANSAVIGGPPNVTVVRPIAPNRTRRHADSDTRRSPSDVFGPN